MNDRVSRRALLKSGCAAATLPLWSLPALSQERHFEPQVGAWRTFEITTTVNVADVKGATQLWLPVPDVNSDYQRSGDNAWTGNADSARFTFASVPAAR